MYTVSNILHPWWAIGIEMDVNIWYLEPIIVRKVVYFKPYETNEITWQIDRYNWEEYLTKEQIIQKEREALQNAKQYIDKKTKRILMNRIYDRTKRERTRVNI